ncbi:hypothetical protein F2Q70_00025107 [Brassica cretica]|uniref:Uncharacterized protein n=1 Tax=Brassica cretica TaxID=69181 RepID=A0A8S9LCJ4_BRACR|nr:hypothetical protein F2Q70_00025107 [Brassica cretica]
MFSRRSTTPTPMMCPTLPASIYWLLWRSQKSILFGLDKGFPAYVGKWGSFLWARLGSGPLHPEGLYLGWGQGSTSSTAFDDRIGSSPPPGVESGSMTIGPQNPYQTSYHVPSELAIVARSIS